MDELTKERQEELRLEQLKLEVLNLPEWYQPMSNSSGSCPWCENMQHWGHDPDCPRRLVLETLRAAIGDPFEKNVALEPQVMGVAEIAALAGVTPAAVANWRSRMDFPRPRFQLRMGPVWFAQREAIESWIERHRRAGRWPGRNEPCRS